MFSVDFMGKMDGRCLGGLAKHDVTIMIDL